ncbi:MAG TPA: hypothetical protein VGK32_02715 [Vicinamibacterales bacterium]
MEFLRAPAAGTTTIASSEAGRKNEIAREVVMFGRAPEVGIDGSLFGEPAVELR